MAILRAGPFGSILDFFVDEPTTPNALNLPINCAKDDSSTNWVWKFLQDLPTAALTYEDGLVDIDESFVDPVSEVIIVRWRYQAAEDFTLNLSYNITASTTGDGFDDSQVRIRIDVNGVEEFSDIDTDSDDTGTGRATSASLVGTESITLPASVVPSIVFIRAETTTVTTGDAIGNITYSIS